MNRVVGILAHVDAGKTTFSEQLLFHAGVLRAAGRVDHRNTLLDAHPLEMQRGITIFSDQAVFERGGTRFFWVDTPGHADFAAEMERALSILDCAVLIVNGAEGIQSHTETLWALLASYGVPTMLFINKTDRAGCDADVDCLDRTEVHIGFNSHIFRCEDIALENRLHVAEDKEHGQINRDAYETARTGDCDQTDR